MEIKSVYVPSSGQKHKLGVRVKALVGGVLQRGKLHDFNAAKNQIGIIKEDKTVLWVDSGSVQTDPKSKSRRSRL